MSAVSKKRAVHVPHKEADPAERARLLNVLAQRRYRERKKARLQELEAKLHAEQKSRPPRPHAVSTAENKSNHGDFVVRDDAHLYGNLDLLNLGGPLAQDVDFETELTSADGGMHDAFNSRDMLIGEDMEATSTESDQSLSWITPSELAYTDLDDTGQGTDSASTGAGRPNWDLQSDNAYVTLPGLAVVRAHLEILGRIQSPNQGTINVWIPTAMSPFIQTQRQGQSSQLTLNGSSFTADYLAKIPANYRPTTTQMTIPHHPIFDLFPWPSVRNTILHMLLVPPDQRPEVMRADDPSEIVVRLMGDTKDASGGLRLWGSNCFDPTNWEVGQLFFERWWWALNGDIVKQSNRWRELRGEPRLNFAGRRF